MRWCATMLMASMTLQAQAAPVETGAIALPSVESAQAFPAAGVRYGRVGGMPAVLVEVRWDGISVDGEPVQVLAAGIPNERPTDGVLIPVYERAIAKVADRRMKGAKGTMLGVVALDGRVPVGTLVPVVESLRFGGMGQILFMTEPSNARESWVPSQVEGGMLELDARAYDAVVSVSSGGFEVVDREGNLGPKQLKGLRCDEPCRSVDTLPWDALSAVLNGLVTDSGAPPVIAVRGLESSMPSGVLLQAIGKVREAGALPTLGAWNGGQTGESIAWDSTAAAPIRMGGRLEGVSILLASLDSGEKRSGLPAFQVEAALRKSVDPIRACVRQLGKDGSMETRLEIGAEGTVQAAMVTNEVPVSASRCLLRVIRSVEFPEPSGDLPIVVTWKFDSKF